MEAYRYTEPDPRVEAVDQIAELIMQWTDLSPTAGRKIARGLLTFLDEFDGDDE